MLSLIYIFLSSWQSFKLFFSLQPLLVLLIVPLVTLTVEVATLAPRPIHGVSCSPGCVTGRLIVTTAWMSRCVVCVSLAVAVNYIVSYIKIHVLHRHCASQDSLRVRQDCVFQRRGDVMMTWIVLVEMMRRIVVSGCCWHTPKPIFGKSTKNPQSCMLPWGSRRHSTIHLMFYGIVYKLTVQWPQLVW